MKTGTFTFWISLLILLWHGGLSKSPTDDEHHSIDSENPEIDVERQDVAVQESFRPRHKYKANGHRSRFYRSDGEGGQEIKAPRCAVMYKDNEPVGILQPFKESYRFLPVSGDPTLVDINPIPVKRRTIMDVLYPSKIHEDYEEAAESSRFADDRYPSIFAKFKIDSRLDKTLKRSMYKRDTEKPEISDELKTTLSKMNGDNSAVVEEELKNILDDMGLIDDYDGKGEAKREAAEDEDMEQGTNKINLVKEEHAETRGKRGDAKSTTEKAQSAASATTVGAAKVRFEEEVDSIDLLNGDAESERKKRQFDKRDDTDALPESNLNSSTLPKEAETGRYEQRVEREIRDKIERLKDEVKEEINNLKKTSEVRAEEPDNRRRKRQATNTLLDEENRDIDPNFSEEEQPEKRHVRRKRSLDDRRFDPIIQGAAQNESEKIELPIPTESIYDNCVDGKCSTPSNDQGMFTEEKVVRSASDEMHKIVNETKLKKNIIKILNVIGKKVNIQNNRFIGINPILQNNTTHFHDRFYRKDELKPDRIANGSDTTKDATNHYNSRSLKQFKEDDTSANVEKTQDTIKYRSSDTLKTRVKRQAKEDSEADYQYGSSEFNDDDGIDNQAYDYQPYASENSVADNQFGNPNCNCDKTGAGCKCGTQKTDLSVPNAKQEYSDYEEDAVEKKSIKHCNCDKNGKHCKCSSFGDGAQYEYAEEPDDDAEERGPRRPRRRRKHAPEAVGIVEGDYYEDYETGGGGLTKREAEPRKRAENQRFQNGEYFVDLHPDTYRLTPMDAVREKRDSLKDLIAVHGGGPAMGHLAAVRQRSMVPHSRIRRRIETEDAKEPRQLIDMSDEDIFGALPQSFAGELARYKRVKRGKTEK